MSSVNLAVWVKGYCPQNEVQNWCMCLLTESLDILECIDRQRNLWSVTIHLLLRKHAYSKILKILPPKNENFQKKKKI